MTESEAVDLDAVAFRPEPHDNAAIVVRDLPAGTRLRYGAEEVVVKHTVLEGHRIVVEPVPDGGALLSWSTPFARARGDLAVADYICTAGSLAALRARGAADLPECPNAVDVSLEPYRLTDATVNRGAPIALVQSPGTFLGYARTQGVAGTRNHVVLIGVTSRSGAFVTELARRLSADAPPALDGIVPVAHTEAGEQREPNNSTFLLSALAGFALHPNVGAVLLVDAPDDVVTTATLRAFMQEQGYPEIDVPHAFFSRSGSFEEDLLDASRLVRPWLADVAAQRRSEQPISDLRIALQCGGSDAFSGITANPLAGAVAAEVVRHGGATILAETDELIGAEDYVLENVRSAEVARRFLRFVETFKERAAWHGTSAEGNPSAGNIYRGLYNIVLKSVGAARKRDRGLRLEHVVGYAQPLPGPGLTFMDSPGNDLESVAGEVASGCNLIFFTTGNGSITNFPFVPTLKFVTTSSRFELLRQEMDVDAGRLLLSSSLEELTRETFDLVVRTASGRPTAGEKAGHSQVSIWRDWKQTAARTPIALTLSSREGGFTDAERDEPLDGAPLASGARHQAPQGPDRFPLYQHNGRLSTECVALVLPTSLCSGQIALRIAGEAADASWAGSHVTRAVALPHTEGCGVSSGPAEDTYARMMTSYLRHPSVGVALLLEHGCEKTHNGYFRSRLLSEGVDPDRFGWCSIQREGGIEAVSRHAHSWLQEAALALGPLSQVTGGLGDLTVALEAAGPLADSTAEAFATLGSWIVGEGGSVLLTSGGELLANDVFRRHAFGIGASPEPTLAHGQHVVRPGWHVMRTPGTNWVEAASGLGAGGAQLMLVHVTGATVGGQRLVPVLQFTTDPDTAQHLEADLDLVVEAGSAAHQARRMLDLVGAAASGRHQARALQTGNVGFQVTRGLLGTSL